MNIIEHQTTPTTKREPQQGDIYAHSDGDTYILSYLGHDKYALICLKSGNRFTDPASLDEAFGRARRKFTLVTTPFTVTPEA